MQTFLFLYILKYLSEILILTIQNSLKTPIWHRIEYVDLPTLWLVSKITRILTVPNWNYAEFIIASEMTQFICPLIWAEFNVFDCEKTPKMFLLLYLGSIYNWVIRFEIKILLFYYSVIYSINLFYYSML